MHGPYISDPESPLIMTVFPGIVFGIPKDSLSSTTVSLIFSPLSLHNREVSPLRNRWNRDPSLPRFRCRLLSDWNCIPYSVASHILLHTLTIVQQSNREIEFGSLRSRLHYSFFIHSIGIGRYELSTTTVSTLRENSEGSRMCGLLRSLLGGKEPHLHQRVPNQIVYDPKPIPRIP